jgi:hypothetical protein
MAQWDSLWIIDKKDWILHVNEGYKQFALDNGAPDLAENSVGRCLWDFVTGPELRELYEGLLRRIRQGLGPFEMPYRCDGPTQRRRLLLRVERVDQTDDVLFQSRALQIESRPAVRILDPSSRTGSSAEPLRFCSWTNRLHTPKGWLEVEEAIAELGLFETTELPPFTHTISESAYEQVNAQIEGLD